MDPCDCEEGERCVISGELGGRECEEGITFVTEFWKIPHMDAPETIRIFEFSMALLIAVITFKNISNLYL